MTVTITLTEKQEAALAAQVAAGDFASIEEAAHAVIDGALLSFDLHSLDHEEGRRLIEEALQSGPPVSIEEHRRARAKFMAELATASA